MPYHKLTVTRSVNIYELPQSQSRSYGDISIGDLHANPIKFLYFLLKYNIVAFKNGIDPYQAFDDLSSNYECGFELLSETLEHQQAYDQNSKKYNPLKKFYARMNAGTLTQQELNNNKFGCVRWSIIIKKFADFLSNIEVKDKNTLVRLIGDELADRGANDIFILMLYQFLQKNHVKTTTLLSNHGLNFLQFYFASKNNNKLANISHQGIKDEQKSSLFGLKHILKMGIVSNDVFKDYVENSYLPTLKVIDYNLTEDGIQLFTHAPVRFDIVYFLAERLEVQYNDTTPELLAETIENINEKFQECLKNDEYNLLSPIGLNNFTQQNTPEYKSIIQSSPFYYVTWNRWSARRERDPSARPRLHPTHNYKIFYIHGHDSHQESIFNKVKRFVKNKPRHIFNLDTICGKGPVAAQERERNPQYFLLKIFNTISHKLNCSQLLTIKNNTETQTITDVELNAISELSTEYVNRQNLETDIIQNETLNRHAFFSSSAHIDKVMEMKQETDQHAPKI